MTLLDDMLEAKAEIDKMKVPEFAGLRVVENPYLPPMAVVVTVGSEYMRKLREQTTGTTPPMTSED